MKIVLFACLHNAQVRSIRDQIRDRVQSPPEREDWETGCRGSL